MKLSKMQELRGAAPRIGGRSPERPERALKKTVVLQKPAFLEKPGRPRHALPALTKAYAQSLRKRNETYRCVNLTSRARKVLAQS